MYLHSAWIQYSWFSSNITGCKFLVSFFGSFSSPRHLNLEYHKDESLVYSFFNLHFLVISSSLMAFNTKYMLKVPRSSSLSETFLTDTRLVYPAPLGSLVGISNLHLKTELLIFPKPALPIFFPKSVGSNSIPSNNSGPNLTPCFLSQPSFDSSGSPLGFTFKNLSKLSTLLPSSLSLP